MRQTLIKQLSEEVSVKRLVLFTKQLLHAIQELGRLVITQFLFGEELSEASGDRGLKIGE